MIVPMQQNGISTDVSGADLNPGQQGLVGAAIAGTAAKALDAGLEVYDHMVRAEAEEANNKKISEITMKSDIKRKELEMNSIGGYMVDENGERTQKTMTQAYHEWANEEFHAGQSSMPNQLGQDMFKARGQHIFTQETSTVHAAEYAKRGAYFKTQREARKDEEGNFLQAFPEIGSLHQKMDSWTIDTHTAVRNNSLAANERDDEIRKGNSDLAAKWMTGEIDKVQNDEIPAYVDTGMIVNGVELKAPKGKLGYIQELKAILKNQHLTAEQAAMNPSLVDPKYSIETREAKGMMTPFKALTPEQNATFYNQLLVLERQLQHKTKTDFMDRARNLTDATNRLPWNEKAFQGLMAVGKQEIAGNPTAKLEVHQQTTAVIVADELSKILPQFTGDPAAFKTQSTEAQKIVLEKATARVGERSRRAGREYGVDEGDLAFSAESAVKEIQHKLHEEMSKDAAAFAKGPMTYYSEFDPQMKAVFGSGKIDFSQPQKFTPQQIQAVQGAFARGNQLLNQHAQSGQRANPETLPSYNHVDEAVAKVFNDRSSGEEGGVANIMAMKKILGPSYENGVNQLVDKKQIDGKFRLVAMMNSRITQRAAYNVVLQESTINKAFNLRFPTEAADAEIKDYVAKDTTGVLAYMYKTDSRAMKLDKITDINSSIVLAAKQMVLKGNIEAKAAAESATRLFLGDQVSMKISMGLFSHSIPVVYPESLNDGSHIVTETDHKTFEAYLRHTMALENIQKQKWTVPEDLGGTSPEKLAQHISTYGVPLFGTDPNVAHPDGKTEQGWYILVSGYNTRENHVTSVRAQVTGEDGKTRYWFVPARRALIEQNSREADAARTDAMRKTPKQNRENRGMWGGGRQPQGFAADMQAVDDYEKAQAEKKKAAADAATKTPVTKARGAVLTGHTKDGRKIVTLE